ncbi:MAG: exo-alpha-sialidase [Anaerolineae bacterium]|nr:exo-alpha-sialidase [Anaerolineae bacterium]
MFQRTPIFKADTVRPACHCSTLIELPNGELLAAWFAGEYEMAPNVAILAARLTSEGWSTPQVVADTPGKAEGQPVFLNHPDGSLWLFYVTVEKSHWTSARMKVKISWDKGQTWEDGPPLPSEEGLMFRSQPLILDTGDILVPVYDEKTWQSMAMLSANGGRTWELGTPIITPPGNIHLSVVTLADGQLLGYLRTGGPGGWIWQATSADGGRLWSEIRPTSIPNPNAGIDLIRLHNGVLLLAFNNSSRVRTPLNVALSEDEGASWTYLQTVAEETRLDPEYIRLAEYSGVQGLASKQRVEYSYPTLLQTRDGLIHLSYTDRRTAIQHAIFDETWLREGTLWEKRA